MTDEFVGVQRHQLTSQLLAVAAAAEDRLRSRVQLLTTTNTGDHMASQQSNDLRANLFGFVGAGLEESDAPSFAAALDAYVASLSARPARSFTAWPKTARLFRDIVVTEKLDGTNAAIHISALREVGDMSEWDEYPEDSWSCVVAGTRYVVSAQSRKRIITPGKTTDNYGFAGWVYDNAAELVSLLGEGLHYGEWWGQGIQRNYGLAERRFSLFNTERHGHIQGAYVGPVRVGAVPVLYEGAFSTDVISFQLGQLRRNGSVAAPGWATPEGLCVYHSASRTVLKATLDANDAGKWEGPQA